MFVRHPQNHLYPQSNLPCFFIISDGFLKNPEKPFTFSRKSGILYTVYVYPPISFRKQMNQTIEKKQPNTIYRTPVATRVFLLVIITVGAALTALMPDILTASVCAAGTAGVFAFYYVLTFSPSVVLTVLPAYLIALLVLKEPIAALTVLLFLPTGAVLSLCMLRRRNKTQVVLAAALAMGLSVLVFFLISYIAVNGTIAPDALLASYNEAFASMREMLLATATETVRAAVEQNPAFAEYYTEAYIRSVVNTSVDSMKLSMPAVILVAAQILGYLAASVFGFFVRLFRCHVLLPRPYHITMSRTSGVVFIISYLVNLFSVGLTASLVGVATGNIATALMPGLFLLGLRSLLRRFTNRRRRRSAIINLVIIGLLVVSYPPYAILFIAVDGLGEVFFDGNTLF